MARIASSEDSPERRWSTFRSYPFPPRASRISTGLIIGLPLVILCVYVTMSLLPIVKDFFMAKRRQLETQQQAILNLPEINSRIEALDARLKLLTTGSIDGRVSALERALHLGNISADQVASLEDLRRELEILKTYMFSDPKGLVELKQMEADYKNLTERQADLATKEDVRSAAAAANDRLYLTWAFLGILFAIILAERFIPRRSVTPTKPITAPPKSEE